MGNSLPHSTHPWVLSISPLQLLQAQPPHALNKPTLNLRAHGRPTSVEESSGHHCLMVLSRQVRTGASTGVSRMLPGYAG
jgi:hypothetical protein